MMAPSIDVKQVRSAYGLTQREFADFVGVNLSTVWRWENGREPRGAAKKLLVKMQEDAPTNTGAAA